MDIFLQQKTGRYSVLYREEETCVNMFACNATVSSWPGVLSSTFCPLAFIIIILGRNDTLIRTASDHTHFTWYSALYRDTFTLFFSSFSRWPIFYFPFIFFHFFCFFFFYIDTKQIKEGILLFSSNFVKVAVYELNLAAGNFRGYKFP